MKNKNYAIIPKIERDVVFYIRSDRHWSLEHKLDLPQELGQEKGIILDNGDIIDENIDTKILGDEISFDNNGFYMITNKTLISYVSKNINKIFEYIQDKILNPIDREKYRMTAVLGNHEYKLIHLINPHKDEKISKKLIDLYKTDNWGYIDEHIAEDEDIGIIRLHDDERLTDIKRIFEEHKKFDILQTHKPKKVDNYADILAKNKYLPKIIVLGHNHDYYADNILLINFKLKNRDIMYAYDLITKKLEKIGEKKINEIYARSINFVEYERKNGEKYFFEIVHPGKYEDILIFDKGMEKVYVRKDKKWYKIDYAKILDNISKNEKMKLIYREI